MMVGRLLSYWEGSFSGAMSYVKLRGGIDQASCRYVPFHSEVLKSDSSPTSLVDVTTWTIKTELQWLLHQAILKLSRQGWWINILSLPTFIIHLSSYPISQQTLLYYTLLYPVLKTNHVEIYIMCDSVRLKTSKNKTSMNNRFA